MEQIIFYILVFMPFGMSLSILREIHENLRK